VRQGRHEPTTGADSAPAAGSVGGQRSTRTSANSDRITNDQFSTGGL
jgi:hypothetical protein